jgi:uncharacterized protein (DUF58 family)
MRPSGRLLRLTALWLALAFVAAFVPVVLWAWSGAAVALGLVAGIDLIALWRRKALDVRRVVAHSLALGHWTDVVIELRNPEPNSELVEVFDGVPSTAESELLPRQVALPASSGASFAYRLRALRRGDAQFDLVQILRTSPWRLWARREFGGSPQTVKIYPDFAAVAGFTLHGLENRIQLMGIRRKQRRGEGLEFRQMREYIEGDTLRQIDWKATSRRRKLISREYQEERDQQLVFLLDCGRRMRAVDGDLTHFDHCLNALLLVSYIALRQGDAVGLMTFGGVDRWLPPVKGRASMNVLINSVYDLDTGLEPSDYLAAAARAKSLQKRRALIVLVTNQRDEDDDELRPALELLRKRHLVLLASLRETSVERLLHAPPDTFEAALRSCAALDYTQARRRSLDRLRTGGVVTLDLEPRNLPVALAEKYLDIKRSGRL